MILVSFRCSFRQIVIFANHSLSFPELADDKSRLSVVKRARESKRERERDVSFVDLLTTKSISQLTWSLEKQWVISKLYTSMTDDEPDP